ncbi:hypothetical protein FACS189475_05870 [Betaproteobacteria bacterium]|nr:hypothetical protein FACS189475_05870 [Betaproteobacteria bacterium]
MENEFDYYLVDSKDEDIYPMLKPDEGQSLRPFHRKKPIDNNSAVKLTFDFKHKKKPQMGDYHDGASGGVFSQRMYELLTSLSISTIEFVPVEIRWNNEIEKNYWAIHVLKSIVCLDRKNAVYKLYDEDDENDINIEELKLDKELLNKIPLSGRLVFNMEEDGSKCLFHKSIVEAIMSINPTGIKFIPADEWKDGVQFDN